MRRSTHISNVLEIAADKAEYDARVKKILSDKQILARIVKGSVKEFKGYSAAVISDCIEGTPEVAAVPVYPGKEAVTGLSTEDSVPNEGKITYDIRFYLITPDRERVKLIINVEAQKDYYPGYDLVTRGVFYGARMLSAQLDTEFTTDNYDGIKKVYSIWICMNTPKNAANTITEYSMTQKNLVGDFQGKNRYDLLSVIMIRLGKNSYKANKDSETNLSDDLHYMLSVLLTKELLPEEKETILSRDYGIVTSVEMKKEMRQMCNLSDLIEEEALEKGIKTGMETGIKRGSERMAVLTRKLIEDNRMEELLKATEEEAFREKLYQEYKIE